MREHRHLLHGARGEHEVPGPDPVEGARSRRRDEGPVEDAEGRRAGEHLRSRLLRFPEEVGSRVRIGELAEMAARFVRLFEHHHPRTRNGRFPSGSQAGRARPDHEDVDVEVHTFPRAMIRPSAAPSRARPSSG